MKNNYAVEKKDAGERLDLYLAKIQNVLSRSAIKKQLNDGVVKINGITEYRPNYKVKESDQIVTEFKEEQIVTSLVPEKIPLNIIYEDDDLLVINKPSGMVVHPATGNWEGTLMNAVLFHYKNQKVVGDDIRSGLVHRLDKDTSGLVLIGKTNKGLWYYSKLFSERRVMKTYIAVVVGDFNKVARAGETTVRNYLGRNSRSRKTFAETTADKGKIAETKFKFRKLISIDNKEYSIVEAKPLTGRTHQIRVHLRSLGYPILGDVIYGRVNKYKRLMLHAWKLSFKGIDGKEMSFKADLPIEFKELNA